MFTNMSSDKLNNLTVLLAAIFIIVGLVYIWTNPNYDQHAHSSEESTVDHHD